MGNIFTPYMDAITRQYPEFAEGDWQIEMMGSVLDELDAMPHDISNRSRELETDAGYFPEDALEQAVEEKTIKCRAPKGCLFVRMVREGAKPALLTVRL